jgi:hypothetical protein
MTCSISDALRDVDLLGAALGSADTWRTWLAVLSAAFGEQLDDDEVIEIAKVAGGRKPPSERVKELWAIAGRRSGKSRMAAAVAVYIAMFQQHRLAPGERGYVLALSASKAQAELIHSYALSFIEASAVLRQQLVNATSEQIELSNGVTIATHTNSFRTVRGRTILACVFDEVAYWRDETSATPDVETYRAVAPSLAASGGMLVGISSPYRRVGLLAARHRDYYGKDSDIFVIQAPTLALNPTLDESIIVRARAEDPQGASSEWDAEFRTDLQSLLSDEIIDAAVDRERPLELPPQSGVRFYGFTDASAGRHDEFTLCVGHVTGDDDDKQFIADVVRGRAPPFDPRQVANEFAALAKQYGISELTGDSFAGEWVAQAFRDAGIGYRKSDLPRSQLYLESLSTFNRVRVRLPDDAKLIRQLRLLERQTHRSGRDSVDHPKNGSDDRSNVVAGCMWLCGLAKRHGTVGTYVLGPDGYVRYDGRGGYVSPLDASKNGAIPSEKWSRANSKSCSRPINQ